MTVLELFPDPQGQARCGQGCPKCLDHSHTKPSRGRGTLYLLCRSAIAGLFAGPSAHHRQLCCSSARADAHVPKLGHVMRKLSSRPSNNWKAFGFILVERITLRIATEAYHRRRCSSVNKMLTPFAINRLQQESAFQSFAWFSGQSSTAFAAINRPEASSSAS